MKTIKEFEEQISKLAREESHRTNVNQLGWLCDHLCEYLERWLGFAKVEQISIKAVLENDLFVCVMAAINLIDEELKTSSKITQTARTRWSEFKSTVEWIKHAPNRDDLNLIENAFILFGQSALSKQFSIKDEKAVAIKHLGIDDVI